MAGGELKRVFFSVPMAIVAVPAAIAVAEGRAEHGRELAQALCSRCHAITASGASPMPQAPPFSEIVRRYPPESLAEALAEGLVTGHPAMPEIRLEPRAIADFLAFLETL